MNLFNLFFKDDFFQGLDSWESALKSELKLEDVSSQKVKKHIDLGLWPTLSTAASQVVSIPAKTQWKKASQTYYKIEGQKIPDLLSEDLENGVRSFFFHAEFLQANDWESIQLALKSFHLSHEIEVFLLGSHSFSTIQGLHVVTLNQLLAATSVHYGGGHNVQELALLLTQLIEGLPHLPTHLGLYLDSHFFKNVAKIRALKLLIQKVLKATDSKAEIKVVTLNSYREWTLFERYSNMLRNNVQVASAYIAGADSIQSSGYQILFDVETNVVDPVHADRSRRMARNSAHILALESMLGIVEDAAFGSFHLENLTQSYASEAWSLMQKLLSLSSKERALWMEGEIQNVSDERLLRLQTRKDVLSGINDFPDGKERLQLQVTAPSFFRTARPFELLRLRMESLTHLPSVQIIYQGDISLLDARVRFIKNYFELLGLEVLDPTETIVGNHDSIIVLCAKDADYPDLIQQTLQSKCVARYIAGKIHHSEFESIFSGQNIFEVLSRLVAKLEEGK